MTDDSPRNDDQSKGSPGVSISRRHVLMTSTVLAASGLAPTLINAAAAQTMTGNAAQTMAMTGNGEERT